MKYLYNLLMILFAAGITSAVSAQTTVVFVPEVQGRTLDGLLQVKLVNTGNETRTATLTITVNEAGSGNVVTVRSAAFQLLPGTQSLPAGAFSKAAVRFGTGKIAAVCRQSGYFTEGDYEYCFELTAGDNQHQGEVLTEQCFSYYLQPFAPLLLISPAEGETICNKRPPFFWQPLLPNIPGVQYRLLLTDVKPGQAKAAAVYYNMPVINQLNINTPMLFYPPSARELTEGSTYAWQVAAYRNEVLLASSEIWEFTVKCEDTNTKVIPESFRDIADLSAGNFYIAKGQLMFAVHNIYEGARLNYKITCISKPEQDVSKLPVVKLKRGNNNIALILEENRSFTDGYYYLLEVQLPSGEKYQLRFLYKAQTT